MVAVWLSDRDETTLKLFLFREWQSTSAAGKPVDESYYHRRPKHRGNSGEGCAGHPPVSIILQESLN